jgi:hypothetical protein
MKDSDGPSDREEEEAMMMYSFPLLDRSSPEETSVRTLNPLLSVSTFTRSICMIAEIALDAEESSHKGLSGAESLKIEDDPPQDTPKFPSSIARTFRTREEPDAEAFLPCTPRQLTKGQPTTPKKTSTGPSSVKKMSSGRHNRSKISPAHPINHWPPSWQATKLPNCLLIRCPGRPTIFFSRVDTIATGPRSFNREGEVSLVLKRIN